MHHSTSDEIPLVKTIQLNCEELDCVDEKGVAVASASIGARVVLVHSHEHSSVPLSSRLFYIIWQLLFNSKLLQKAIPIEVDDC